MDRPPGGESARSIERAERTYHSRSCELDLDSMTSLRKVDWTPRVRWRSPNGFEIAGRGRATRFRTNGSNRFDTVRAAANQWFARIAYDGPAVARPRAIGGVSFHDDYEPDGVWTGFDAASFVVPEVQVLSSDSDIWLTVTTVSADETNDQLERWRDRLEADCGREGDATRPENPGPDTTPGVLSTTRSTTAESWTEQVDTVLERIGSGQLTKVVIAQSLSTDLVEPIDVPATLARLGRTYPNCYQFSIRHESGGTFFGTPPERLVLKRGRTVETEALAGSVQRGETPVTDESFERRMRTSDRLQHEHALVVETIRDQLEALSESVSVTDQQVRKLATIQHLQTPITATLEPDRHVLEVVEALHPTPAVGGLPRGVALETIRSTERFDRGWYAAPVGWFDGNGDGEFAVGIRSAVTDDRTATLFAGNGIVADSDPDEEWAEVQLKFRPILEELR